MSAIDLRLSNLRIFMGFLGSCIFVAVALRLAIVRPNVGADTIIPGSFRDYEMRVCAVFFGFCAALWGLKLFQSDPVVSVGSRGIYDRRLSTDWIPWEAIRAIKPAQFWMSSYSRLEIDPEASARIQWTRRARFASWLNLMFGRRYRISGAELSGGVPALAEAIGRSRPER
ncbi:hypothetical protein PQI07_19040 [Methylobacterium sp. 092160098-2]|uniref:hypothetical protein n=1 Tax=Methylobacterium sp. 092160098-2 TaxID=3025129 RepID=UPI0023819EFA|nr:hypothetical protein [Methylobacterium sp. 092160098-2]MDE4912782.1 hypothetical protein [Methylobacterium sp. 092160098-2]